MPEIGISGLPLDYPFSGSAVYVRNLISELPKVAPDLHSDSSPARPARIEAASANESPVHSPASTAVTVWAPASTNSRGR